MAHRLRALAAQLDSGLDAAAAIAEAARWGCPVVPTIESAERLAAEFRRRLRAVDRQLVEAAVDPVDLTPAPAEVADWDLDTMPAETVTRVLARVPLQELADLIRSLAGPDGELAVLAEVGPDDDGRLDRLLPAEAGSPVDDWLSVISTVSEPIGLVDCELIRQRIDGASGGYRVFTTEPDDPWQRVAATAVDEDGETRTSPPPMIVGFAAGVDHTSGGQAVAGGLVDRFSEAVPDDRRPPSVAFGFDAPRARAPQAVLVGVSPGDAIDWSPTGRDLLSLVLDARALARARMAPRRPPEPG